MAAHRRVRACRGACLIAVAKLAVHAGSRRRRGRRSARSRRGTRPPRPRSGRPRPAGAPASIQAGWKRSTAGSAMASSARKPASGPSIWPSTAASATAAPSDGATRTRARYSLRSASRSTSAGAQCADWIAASYWKRPGRPKPWARRSRPSPRAISVASQRVASCSSSGTNRPSLVAPRRPAGLGQAHQRRQPEHLRLVGQQFGQHQRQVQRLGRQRFDRCGLRRQLPVDRVCAVDRFEHRGQPLRPGRRARAARTGCPHRECVSWPAPAAAPWRPAVRPRRPRRRRPPRRRAPSAASAGCGCSAAMAGWAQTSISSSRRSGIAGMSDRLRLGCHRFRRAARSSGRRVTSTRRAAGCGRR